MRIARISNNGISFKRCYTTGRDANSLDNLLRPYRDKLNALTKDYDVEIKTGKALYINDAYHGDMIPIYPTTVSIEPSVNSAYYTIPKIKLYINHAANPCLGSEYEVKDIMETIKKGIGIFKN